MLRRLVEDAMKDPEFAGKFNPSSALAVLRQRQGQGRLVLH